MAAMLTYFIWEGILVGVANRHHIFMPVGSGGGAGSKSNSPTETANNPYATGTKTAGSGAAHIHGGPIPPGRYRIHTPPKKHPHLGLACYLEPAGANMMGRSGFFIHGRGPHGSDGCLVPNNPNDFSTLMEDLKKEDGGYLYVFETVDEGRFA